MSYPEKISDKSAPAFNSALNIFAVPPTNVAVQKSFFRELLPQNGISQEPYTFRLYNDNLWADLSRVYLGLELSIRKLDNAGIDVAIDANDFNIGPIQAIGQSFVNQLKVSVGNTEIYDSGTLYPYKSYITNELSYPASVKSTFLASSGYYPDTEQNARADPGFTKRVELFSRSRHAQFLSRLDFDLGNQELYLLNNITVDFHITKCKDAFLLHRLGLGDANNYRLAVHSVKLYVKMVDVQPSLNMSVYSMLEKQPAKYALRKTEMRSHLITAGRTDVDYNVFTSTIPRRVTIGFVRNAAFQGDYDRTPFNFQPFGVRDISVHAGGLNYPSTPYTNLNFESGLCMRAFVDMYEALGCANRESCCDITFEQFKSGWTFFVVSLTSTLDDSCGFELIRNGSTSIHVQFHQGLADPVQMIVLAEFDQMVMVDFNRRVTSDNAIA